MTKVLHIFTLRYTYSDPICPRPCASLGSTQRTYPLLLFLVAMVVGTSTAKAQTVGNVNLNSARSFGLLSDTISNTGTSQLPLDITVIGAAVCLLESYSAVLALRRRNSRAGGTGKDTPDFRWNRCWFEGHLGKGRMAVFKVY